MKVSCVGEVGAASLSMSRSRFWRMERTELTNGSTSDADYLASFDGFFLLCAFCLPRAVGRGLNMAGSVGTAVEASRGETEEV